MVDKVFQVIGKKSVTPEGVILYPVQEQLSGEFLTMNMGSEDSEFLVPGAFLCYDTGSGDNIICPVGSLTKVAEHYGLKDYEIRFGKVLKVYPIKGSASFRINVIYIMDNNEFNVCSVEMHPGPRSPGKKYPDIVDGRVVVLALSLFDEIPLGAWPLNNDV